MKTTTLAIVFSILVISAICQDSKGKGVGQSDQSQMQSKGAVGQSADQSQQHQGKGAVGQSADQFQFQGKGKNIPAAFLQQDTKGKGVGQSDQSQMQSKGAVGQSADQSQQHQGKGAVGQDMPKGKVGYARVRSHYRVRAAHRN
jgi:hypothetical protein